MYACPSCKQPIFTWWQKVNATALKPVFCSSCDNFSATYLLPHTWVFTLLLYSELLLYIFVLLAMLLGWIFILFIPILLLVFCLPLITPLFPLKTISYLEFEKAKKLSRMQKKFRMLPMIITAAIAIIFTIFRQNFI